MIEKKKMYFVHVLKLHCMDYMVRVRRLIEINDNESMFFLYFSLSSPCLGGDFFIILSLKLPIQFFFPYMNFIFQ